MGNRFCRICGEHKPLTLEHIPPRSTGNDHVVVVHRGDEAVMHSLFDIAHRTPPLREKRMMLGRITPWLVPVMVMWCLLFRCGFMLV